MAAQPRRGMGVRPQGHQRQRPWRRLPRPLLLQCSIHHLCKIRNHQTTKVSLIKCTTLNLGYKGHLNLAQLALTLIFLTILTSFDPKPDPYFQPRNFVRYHYKLQEKAALIRKHFSRNVLKDKNAWLQHIDF